MNKQNRNRLIDTEKELMVARGEAGRGWVKKRISYIVLIIFVIKFIRESLYLHI